MRNSETLNIIEGLAQKVAGHKSLKVYDIELSSGGQGRVLRVFLSKADGLVSLDDCSEFSKALSLVLDVEDPISGNYHLEVSSPGLERKLTRLWHFEESTEEDLMVQVERPLMDYIEEVPRKHSNRKKFQGRVVKVDGETVTFCFEDFEFDVPFGDLTKAKVVFDFNSPKTEEK